MWGPLEHTGLRAGRYQVLGLATIMHRVCICLPRQLSQLGEAVVSRCSDAVSQKIKFTQCDVDDHSLLFSHSWP